MRLALTLGLLGFTTDAQRAREDALAWAAEGGQPYDRAVGLVFGTLLALESRDLQRLRRDTATLAAEDATRDAWHLQVAAEAFTGYLEAFDGGRQAGVTRIQQALADPRSAEQPAPGLEAFIVRVLLEACAVAGDVHVGLHAAERLLKLGNNHLWDAEARRLRAEFLALLDSPRDEITAEFERALGIARRQGAKLFELRAGTSLLRHCRARGDCHRAGAAHDVLAAIVAAYPDRAATPDLGEATALLASR